MEILVLGELTLRRGGTPVCAPTGKAAAILQALALSDTRVTMSRLQGVIAGGSLPGESAVRQHVRVLREEHHVPIITGPRNTRTYELDAGRCRVDARRFVAGVDAGEPIDDLLGLWRGPVDARRLNSEQWARVRSARRQLIGRIARLPEPERSSLTGLARFADLFPGDREVDRIRPSGPGSKPLLLIVEDDPDVMREICQQLSAYYRFLQIADIEEWGRLLEERPEALDTVQGALVDLHLTKTLDDLRGLQVVKYLRDRTDILAALVTANAMESSDYKNKERKAEFRLVAIVNKKESDWWNALEIAAELLVGEGDEKQRHRLETRLETAYRVVRREHQHDLPGSVGADRLKKCAKEYAAVIGHVKVGPLDEARAQVDRFCRTWSRGRS